ncbi:MAG: dTMP kinase [Gemmatimonadaceae bacterium]|nr:dTMP kinase [Gemmatimonadaceae bacterium]
MAGALVVFEGVEGAGKSTQVARLVERLRASGREVLSLREPGGTSLGDAVRGLLLDPSREIPAPAEALLFLASRATLMAQVVQPALARDAIVVLDRFFLSTYAYQVAGRGLDAATVRAANLLAIGDVRPDVTCVLELPVAEGMARANRRGATDRIEQAGSEFHQRVADAFRRAVRPDWQAEHPECGRIVSVDARGTADDVAGRVASILAEHLPDLRGVLQG